MLGHTTTSWTYRTFPLETPTEAFGPFQDVVGLWREKCGPERRYPAWADFELEDFEGWYGQLSLGEVMDDPFDVLYRLWGTQLVAWWDLEMTGKALSTYPWSAAIWEEIEKPYMLQIVTQGEIGFVSGRLTAVNREIVHIEGIEIPLATAGRISHVLSAYRNVDRKKPFVPDAEPTSVR